VSSLVQTAVMVYGHLTGFTHFVHQ